MLQSLKLDATSSSKAKDRTEDASGVAASSDAGISGFSGVLAALAGSFQVAPVLSNLPTASAPEVSRSAAGANRAASRDWSRASAKDARAAANDARNGAASRSQAVQKQGSASASPEASSAQKRSSQAPARVDDAQAHAPDPKVAGQGSGSENPQPQGPEEIQALAQAQEANAPEAAEAVPVPVGASASPADASSSEDVGAALLKGLKTLSGAVNAADPSGAQAGLKDGPNAGLGAGFNDGFNAGSGGDAAVGSASGPTSGSAFTISTNPAAEAPGQDANALVISTDTDKLNIAENTLSTMLAQNSTATVKNDALAAEVLGGKDALGALDGSQTAQTAKAPLSHGVDAAMGSVRAQTAAAQAPAQTSPVRTSPALSQVEGTIRWMVRNQEKSAELQLHPENLGRVTISLKVEGNEVHARVWASESSSAALLQDQRTALEQSLKDQGLNLASFDLQSGNRGEDAQRQTPMPQAAPSEPAREVVSSRQDAPTGGTPNLSNAYQIEVFA